ncbi:MULTISPECIES: hypothetical protein [Streptomyces]|uniref:hypothetical protein n=1 Tax=Streptomyces TaxID=1883 RepID=UPI00342636D5
MGNPLLRDLPQPELLDRAQIDGPRIILVEDTDPAVVQGNTGIAERAAQWRVHRADLYPQSGVEDQRLVVPGLHEILEPEARQCMVQVRDREVGKQDGDVLAHVPALPLGVVVVVVQMRNVEVVRRGRPAGSTPVLPGKGAQEPKWAGVNQGSHTIDPAADSMNRPAWPIEVIRIALFPECGNF